MALVWLGFVSAEQSVPPGEIEAKVAVRLPDDHGMMDPMHIGRDDKESKNPVNSLRNMDVAVVEHGGGIKSYLEDEYGQQEA
jgi:hypothetical protein